MCDIAVRFTRNLKMIKRKFYVYNTHYKIKVNKRVAKNAPKIKR